MVMAKARRVPCPMRKLCVAADPRLPSRTTNCKDPSAQTQLEPKARDQGEDFSTSVEHRPPVEGGAQGGGGPGGI